jgi:hypothetical protein
MPEKVWLFLINPFITSTKGSFEKMRTLSTFTDSRLATDPTLATQYAFLHPKLLAFRAAYDAWKGGGSDQKSLTASLKVLLDEELPRQLKAWDFEIQHFATKGTAEYLKYFPHGYSPFTRGKQETKIGAVAELVLQLGKRTPVPPIKDTINDFLTDLNAANSTQKDSKGDTGDLSDAVEAARIELAGAMYSVLGHLMSIHWANPEVIGNYFDLELLRKKPQEDFTGHVAAGAIRFIVQRTMEADDMVLLKNTGTVALTWYLAETKGAAHEAGAPSVTVEPGQQTSVAASALGNVATDKYLMVFNASELTEGAWEVEI